MKDAIWAARLHLQTGTLLSDDAIKDICRALVELNAQPCRCAASPSGLPHQRDEHCLLFTDGIKVTP